MPLREQETARGHTPRRSGLRRFAGSHGFDQPPFTPPFGRAASAP